MTGAKKEFAKCKRQDNQNVLRDQFLGKQKIFDSCLHSSEWTYYRNKAMEI